MLRLLVVSLFLNLGWCALAAQPTPAAPALGLQQVDAPAGRGASSASLATAPDGAAWLTWIEPAAAGGHALRFSIFDAARRTWSAPRQIAAGRDWFVNWADFPALTLGPDGRATAVWFVNNPAPAQPAGHDHDGPGYRAFYATSTDRGGSWSAPAPVTAESTTVEFVSLATLADGRILAAWLDGRARKTGAPMQLYARVLGAPGPDALVDASVCDCCATSLTAFLDGSALLAYRGRTKDEVRDIRTARFDGRAWGEPRALNNDGWKIAGCPVNGPQLASDGGRVAAAWFTAADNDPRVLATFSSDAGTQFLMPLRLDERAAKPLGRVDALLLRDSAMLITWVAADGAVWLRRISPDHATSAAIKIAPRGSGSMRTVTRAALVRDYPGGDTSAEVLVAFVTDAGLRTALVTIPEGKLRAAEKNCDCAPTAEELQGFPMRGTILEATAATHTVRAQHPDIPGVFRAGTHEFSVAPGLAERLPGGGQFLGRIERREGRWWLFDIRLLATPAR